MSLLSLSGHRFIAASATVLALSGCANPPAADARDMVMRGTETAAVITDIDAYIAEASHRFGIPERWIRAVIRAESANNPRAVSGAGAMGLMQIMPGTWAELRAAHGLGADPFDRRDNILAGTAYLRQMYDRFGAPGFLAAYNAGPGRYANHLRTGRPLPRETRNYVAMLSHQLGFGNADRRQEIRVATAGRWQDAPLFAHRSTAEDRPPSGSRDDQQRSIDHSSQSDISETSTEGANPLFVSRSGETDR